MAAPLHTALTRRERHIMDVLFRLGRATAEDVMHEVSGKPSYSTVRTQLRVLEQKGHVRHEERGRQFVYSPAVPRRTARKSALRHVVETFFDGSVEQVVGALLGGEGARVSEEELDRIVELVAQARGRGAERGVGAPASDELGGVQGGVPTARSVRGGVEGSPPPKKKGGSR